MPRGVDQKIFFPVRPEHHDHDVARVEEYIATLRKGKENKSAEFYSQEGKKGELSGVFIVLVDKKNSEEKQKALNKGFLKHDIV